MDWRRVLESEEFSDGDEIADLKESLLSRLKSQPVGPVYRNVCRMLAELKLQDGEELEAISLLIESHAASLRMKLEYQHLKNSRKDEKITSLIDKEYVQFKGNYYSSPLAYIKRLEELPQEWTVIQISCGPDSRSMFGVPEEVSSITPTLYITRMECGPLASQQGHHPFCVTVQPHSVGQTAMYKPLFELEETLKCNKTDRIIGNRMLYWSTRRKVDNGLQTLVDFVENWWLCGWQCLFPGKFIDQNLQLELEKAVNKILSEEAGVDCNCETEFPPRSRQMLYCAARNLHLCSSDQLSRVVAGSIGEQRLSPRTQRLTVALRALSEEFALRTAKKHPVILIVDERLDSIPWEKCQALADEPVTRIPSLHILQGLYEVHKDTVVNGLKIVDPSKGYFIINPDQNLPDSESRMREFLLPRVPSWSGKIGDRPTPEDFAIALHNSSMFLYVGHGSGIQFYSMESLRREITSASLLYGCGSARLNLLGGDTESDGRVLIYTARASPCVLGMLWEVTDRDTDGLAQRMLDAWLPRNQDGEDKEAISEPELLRAMHIGRRSVRFYATSAALIARGLPVKIQ